MKPRAHRCLKSVGQGPLLGHNTQKPIPRLADQPQLDAIASIWHDLASPGTPITSRPIFRETAPLPAMLLPAFGRHAIENRNRPVRDGSGDCALSHELSHFPMLQASGLVTSRIVDPAFARERNSETSSSSAPSGNCARFTLRKGSEARSDAGSRRTLSERQIAPWWCVLTFGPDRGYTVGVPWHESCT